MHNAGRNVFRMNGALRLLFVLRAPAENVTANDFEIVAAMTKNNATLVIIPKETTSARTFLCVHVADAS